MASFRCDGTLDIECAQWTRFGVAAIHDRHGSRVHRTVESLVDDLLRCVGVYWAHAGGKYDFLPIAEEFRRRGVKCQMDPAGSRISRIVAGKLQLRDSYLLIPLKQSTACSMVGAIQVPLGLPCICGAGCGGFCSIRPHDERPPVAERCVSDSETLFQIIWKLHDTMDEHGIHLRGTLGTTAWTNAQARLNLPDAAFPPSVWRALRESYFGGRNGVFRPHVRHDAGFHWDMSSAYPSALSRCEVPAGEWSELGSRDALKALKAERPGVYRCTVRVPDDCFLPPLPVRGDNDRIMYPVGEFTGSWVMPELELAIGRDVEIVRVHSAIVWERTERIFEGLMTEWIALRQSFGKRSALGSWMRLLSNNLPGKFAEGPDRRSIQFFPDPKKIRTCNARRPCSILRCVGACKAWEQIDMDGAIWGVPYLRYAKSGHVHWAAYLTAETRAEWLRAAEMNPSELVYGATDSIWTTSSRAPGDVGDGLGEWELKCKWTAFESVGPGAYRYRDDQGKDWIKTSGISISDEEWLSGRADRFDVAPLISAAQTGGSLFQRLPRKWSLNRKRAALGIYGDRILDPRDGMTYPMRYGESPI